MFGLRKKIDIHDFAETLGGRFYSRISGHHEKNILIEIALSFKKYAASYQLYADLKNQLSSLKKSKLKKAVDEIHKEKKVMFLNHLNCIEFMTMMASYKDFAEDTYMKGDVGITPMIYIDGKALTVDREVNENNDHPKITLYDKYYEKLILTKKRYKPAYGGYAYRYFLSDDFIESSINIFNETFFNNLLDANEINILNKYFLGSYEYWGNEFKKIRLYHRERGGKIGSPGFDIGAM